LSDFGFYPLECGYEPIELVEVAELTMIYGLSFAPPHVASLLQCRDVSLHLTRAHVETARAGGNRHLRPVEIAT